MKLLNRALLLEGLLLCTGIADATPILDQQNAPEGNFPAAAVANDRSQVQTFTVDITGTLTRIDVEVEKGLNTFEDLLFSLALTNAGGLPTIAIAERSAPASAIENAGPPEFVSFDLSAALIQVVTGEVLAIVLDSKALNTFPGDERYLWEYGGPYFRGTAFTLLDSKFHPFPETDDFHFKTFVEPVPEPGTLNLLVGGLLVLACLRFMERARVQSVLAAVAGNRLTRRQPQVACLSRIRH